MAPEKNPFHLGGATQKILHLYRGTRVRNPARRRFSSFGMEELYSAGRNSYPDTRGTRGLLRVTFQLRENHVTSYAPTNVYEARRG
eukprot:523222-Rhodomonas_salina.1